MKKPSLFRLTNNLFRLFLGAVFLLTGYSAHSEVVVTNSLECAEPQRTVQIGESAITVTYDFSEVREVVITSDSNMVYHSIPGFGQCNETGKPFLPMRVDTFRVPYGYDLSISVSESNAKQVLCTYAGVPEPVFDSYEEHSLPVEVSPYSGIFPLEAGSLLSTYTVRNETLAEVLVCPVKYDYENGIATISENVSYTLSFTPKGFIFPQIATLELDDKISYGDRFLTEFLSNSLVKNMNKVGNSSRNDLEGFEGTVGYIIVTTDNYLGPVSSFARWKKILGFTPHIISNKRWDNWEEVWIEVQECLKTNDDIAYMIIIGDTNDVPQVPSSRYKYHYSDIFYGLSSNGSMFPDIYIGRIPVSNTLEANKVINKLVRAEMCPVIDDEYYKSAAHCSRFESKVVGLNVEDRRFVLTSEEIRDYVNTKGIKADRFYEADSNINPQFYSNKFSYGQAIPADLQRPAFSWKTSVDEIVEKINSGCLYALYRGHGSPEGWNGVNLTSSSLPMLNNYEKYPIVFSITCQTGMMCRDIEGKTRSIDCFASKLLKMPEAGAVAVIASSESSLSGYNDSLIEGVFDAIWPSPGLIPRFRERGVENDPQNDTPDPTYRLGQILEQGLFRMNEQWGTVDKNRVLYQYELYHIFGDPSMLFFTENPQHFSNVEIIRDENGIWVSTNGEQASISFYNYETDSAYKYETDEVYFPTEDEQNTIVCLTGHNRLTHLDGILVPVSEEPATMPYIQSCGFVDASTASVKFLPGNRFNRAELSVFDVTGRLVASSTLDDCNNLEEVKLPIANARGVFVITLSIEGIIVETKKIIN